MDRPARRHALRQGWRREVYPHSNRESVDHVAVEDAAPGARRSAGAGMTSVSCRQCGSKFAPTPRAGRDTHRSRSGRARSFTDAQFCSRKCRKANYRWRRSQERSAVTRKAEKIGKGPGVLSAVTPLVQHIDITNEIPTKTEGARPRQIAGPPLSARSLHLASLPLDPETAANVRRANREVCT